VKSDKAKGFRYGSDQKAEPILGTSEEGWVGGEGDMAL
jgi:hypothetical protein